MIVQRNQKKTNMNDEVDEEEEDQLVASGDTTNSADHTDKKFEEENKFGWVYLLESFL